MRPLPAVRHREDRGKDAGAEIFIPSIPTTSRSWSQIWEWSHEELAVSEGHRRSSPASSSRGGSRRLRVGVQHGGRSASGYYLDGGPFYQWRAEVRHDGELDLEFVRHGNSYRSHFKGVLPVTSYFSSLVPRSRDIRPNVKGDQVYLFAFGPQAYRQTRPGNPEASLGQFIGELRDLPQIPFKNLVSWPRIRSLAGVPFRNWGLALRNRLWEFVRVERELGTRQFLRNARRGLKPGGEYLNLEFGWIPFIRDLVSAHRLSLEIDAKLQKLKDENGKGIHRRATLLATSKTEDLSYGRMEPFSTVGGGAFGPGGIGVVGQTLHSASRTVKERVWFSGKYKYWIPDTESPQWNARAIAALYGLLPTPSLAWELTPFSWLHDWFLNTGDVISNVSTNAVDNLVLEYGFLMRNLKETVRARAHVTVEPGQTPGYNQWERVDNVFESFYEKETKCRVRAYPFFPGAQPWVFDPRTQNPFSKRQWAILTALGLSQVYNR